MKTKLGGLYIGTCTFPFAHLLGYTKKNGLEKESTRGNICIGFKKSADWSLLGCINWLMK